MSGDIYDKLSDSKDSILKRLLKESEDLAKINISERTREIATLKVLGFKSKDVNNYITRIDEMIERKRAGIETWL